MANRSAHATIKGYFYQFDHTIVQLLQASAAQSSVVVEGVEDIDLDDGDDSALVQCKYYEGSEYNHSLIKDAVIQMLRHFNAAGCLTEQKFGYRIYGHYKQGQGKFSSDFDLELFKNNFLSYKKKKKVHKVHVELGVTDAQLASFRKLLAIDLHAPSYGEQQKKIIDLLISQVPDCSPENAEAFYYPNAINVIQSLAINSDASQRRITKARFIQEVNRKEIVFSEWLRQKFGNDYFVKLIKQKHFKFSSTKVPNTSRIFAIDMTGEFSLPKAVALLEKIGCKYSHVEHMRTPPNDRFCPYVLLYGLTPQELISLKSSLLRNGIKFEDGYPFNGSGFYPALLSNPPTKENLIRIKFVPTAEDLASVSYAAKGFVEIFDFFKLTPIRPENLPADVTHYPIKIDSTNFINEVL